MKKLLLGLVSFLAAGFPLYGQLLDSPASPSYDRSTFHQSIGFHNTSQNVFFEDYNGFLELAFDNNFTLEFWVKIPSSVPPGTMILRTNNFDVNFASSDDGNGNLSPGLIFLVKSYDSEGHPFPGESFFYHMTGQDLPYFNDWFHVAIVRNRSASAPYHPFSTYPGTMRMYINGHSSTYADTAPLAELLPLGSGGGIHLALGYTPYLKIDEFRIWNTPRTPQEIYTHMNEAIAPNAAGLIAYYSFDHSNVNSPGYLNLTDASIPNESRGAGSPATDGSELAGWVYGHPSQGAPPVSGTDRNYLSVSDGPWDDAATWGGEVPREDEIVTVEHSVTLDRNRTQGGLQFRGPIASARVSGAVSEEKLVYTNGHTLKLLSPPTGGDATRYVVTNGGKLIVENIPYTGVKIPVGTATAYRPVTVAQEGRNQFLSFSIEAKDDISPTVSADAAVVNASWELAPLPKATGAYTLRFQWNGSDESDGFSHEGATVANYHNSSWNFLTSEPVAGDLNGAYSIGATVSEFSPFIITSDQSSLPVRLVHFDVTREGETAVLKWSASDAENFAGFEIERSTNSKTWTTIAKEPNSKQGSLVHHYTFIDHLPEGSFDKLYYRLKMIDLDNSFVFSAIKSIALESPALLTVFPNPVQRNSEIQLRTRLDLSGSLQSGSLQSGSHLSGSHLSITSLAGQRVYDQAVVRSGSLKLPDIPPGIYILSLKDEGGRTYREKILVR
jgi:hypothetical protein